MVTSVTSIHGAAGQLNFHTNKLQPIYMYEYVYLARKKNIAERCNAINLD
jgi:hypothetical protein